VTGFLIISGLFLAFLALGLESRLDREPPRALMAALSLAAMLVLIRW